VTRRLSLEWPDRRPFADRDRPIRILAASDEVDPALDDERNRNSIGPIDLVVGCGDLSPDRLCFLADAFRAPLVYVRGNHDRGGPWPQPRQLPQPSDGRTEDESIGLPLLGLSWPSREREPARHDERAAWRQAIRLAGTNLLLPAPGPTLVFSHVPPRGAGDTPSDPYHVGFAAYRFVLDRLRPPLWLHGHSAMAASPSWHVKSGETVVVNVTGTVLLELMAPAATRRNTENAAPSRR
jgi:predicted phosphodiesterase